MNKISLNKILYIITIGIFIALCAPSLFSNGMFMDGLIYAGISNNLANGMGTFWNPHFTDYLFPSFHQHPPLAFGMQSIAFKIFGSSFLIERLVSLLTYIITGIFMVKIFNRYTKNTALGWWVLFIWILVPKNNWSCSNNMLENYVMMFIVVSVWFMHLGNNKSHVVWYFFAGFFLLLGFLTKGFTALFPLSFPFWNWVVKNETFKKMLLKTGLLLVGLILPLLLFFVIFKEAYPGIMQYIDEQVVRSIEKIETVDHRFQIVIDFFNQILPFLIILLILFSIRKFKYKKPLFNLNYSKPALAMFLLALSGVLPIMVSMKQRAFYIIPVFPFYALCFALITYKAVELWVEKTKQFKKRVGAFKVSALVIVLVTMGLTINFWGIPGRNKAMLNDVQVCIEKTGNNKTINIPKYLFNEWSLHGYFTRMGFVSLNDKDQNEKYYLCNKGDKPKELEGFIYAKVNVATQRFDLFEKVKQ